MSGLKIATSFGLAPNYLGFCGPQNNEKQKILREYLYSGKRRNEAKKILSQFEGAFSYYQLIAKKNNIKNPFDKKVVDAYWIGNDLLRKVDAKDIGQMILDNFTRPGLLSKKEAARRIKKIPKNAKPHHSFHVFILGTVTGKIDLDTIELKDICRSGWGKIKKIDRQKSKILVEYQPIIKSYKFGEPKIKKLDWDKKIIPNMKIGNWIAFHWNRTAKLLSKKEIENLIKYTQDTLNSI